MSETPEVSEEISENLPADIAALSFEEALSALENIVQKLESGQISLDESIDKYTRGNLLRVHCQQKLKDASARIEKITRMQDGGLSVSPLDSME